MAATSVTSVTRIPKRALYRVHLKVVIELRAQGFAGTMQPRFHRGDREARLLAHLACRELVDVPESEHRLVRLREVGQRGIDKLFDLILDQVRFRIGRVGGGSRGLTRVSC